MGHDRRIHCSGPVIAPDVEVVPETARHLTPDNRNTFLLPLFLPDITRRIPVLPRFTLCNIIRVLDFPSILRARKIRRHARRISPRKSLFSSMSRYPDPCNLPMYVGIDFSRNTEPEKSKCLTQARRRSLSKASL